MFEVQDLRYATLATVSRCGMVWFSEDVLSLDMISDNFLQCLRTLSIDDNDEHVTSRGEKDKEDTLSPGMKVFNTLCGTSEYGVLCRYREIVLICWRATSAQMGWCRGACSMPLVWITSWTSPD